MPMHELDEVCDCVNGYSFAVGEKLNMLWHVEEPAEHMYVDAEWWLLVGIVFWIRNLGFLHCF